MSLTTKYFFYNEDTGEVLATQATPGGAKWLGLIKKGFRHIANLRFWGKLIVEKPIVP